MTVSRPGTRAARIDRRYAIVEVAILIVFLVLVSIRNHVDISEYWLQATFLALCTAGSQAFRIRVSAVDEKLSVGIEVALLGIAIPSADLLTVLPVWLIGLIVGAAGARRNLLLAARIGARAIFAGLLYGATSQVVGNLVEVPIVGSIAATVAYLVTILLLWSLPAIVAGEDPAVLLENLIPRRIAWALVMIVAIVFAADVFDPYVNQVLVSNPDGLKLLIRVAVATAVFAVFGFLVYAYEARRRLDGLISTATHLPWPDDPDPLQQMIDFATHTLRASTIEVRTTPPVIRTEIGAAFQTPFGETKYLIARRGPTRSPMLDRDLEALSAIAHIGQETMRVRGEATELRTEASTDPLTGLFNYRGFQAAIHDVTLRRGDAGGVAIIYIDLDGFKAINDRHGHSVGNEILQVVAHRLAAAVRPRDAVARVGGDEFVVLLRDISDERHAEQVAHRIIDLASSPVVLEGQVIKVGLSSGVSFALASEAALDQLVDDADSRMYAKRGRERPPDPATTSPRDKVADPQTSKRVAAIADLVNDRRLRVEYQPIVDAGRGLVVSLESLVRAEHPTYGPIEPALLIHEASRLGLLDSLTRQVLDRTFVDLERIRAVAPTLQDVSVNIELDQLAHVDIREHMLALCRQHPDVHLTMEITENSLNRISDEISAELDELREGGLRLALDDFGQGFSTMLAIAQLPFDALKVDRSLIATITTSRKSRQVIGSLTKLCRSLHVRMVVEGVEQVEERDILQRLGVRYMQGFLFSRSETVENLCQRLAVDGLVMTPRQSKGVPAGPGHSPETDPDWD